MCKKVNMGRPRAINYPMLSVQKSTEQKNLDLIRTKDALQKRNAREKLKNNKNAYEE